MKTYRIKIILKSSLITYLQADTLFGHIMWAIRYIKGNKFLEELLEEYSKTPSFLISDGFKSGYLPRPIVAPIDTQALQEIIKAKKNLKDDKKELVNALIEIKELKKVRQIPFSIYEKLSQNYNEEGLYTYLLKDAENILGLKKEEEEALITHNTINRVTNSVLEEGGFFQQTERFYKKGYSFDIYIKVLNSSFSMEDIKEALEYISQTGFGKDKSTGKGYFQIESLDTVDLDRFKGNAVMSLSTFIPSGDELKEGYYEVFTKFGKLGGDYAMASKDVYYNPFKKPLIMMKPGSTFYCDSIKPYFGSLIEDVHSNPKIKHYAFMFPIGINIKNQQ